MAASLDGQLSALIAAAKATTSAEQRAVEARAELEQLAQSPEGRRQIDALAAERVMGWVRRTNGDVGGYATGEDVPEHEREYDLRLCEYWWEKLPDGMWKSHGSAEGSRDESAWSPTTSIADAWQLVGRLAKSNIRIRLIDDRDRIDKWSVRFYGYPSSTKIEYITHDDECIAITIAAILAGGEKEKA